MRDDDYVVGLEVDGQARAYPLWVIDHYHIVNDRAGGEQVVVVSCERCQTGGAFIADVEGNPARPPLFRGVGFMNATLIMRDIRTGSYWNHSVGQCLSGRVNGAMLPWLPTFHAEWKDWREWHPDTTVMAAPDDPHHPDARHGHGRDEFFARPGMEPVFVPTITGELDTTYPENEMVLCVGRAEDPAAYPLREVQREGGVVRDSRNGTPFTVLAGPRADGFTMAAYLTTVEGVELTFERRGSLFEDARTGSTWTIEGLAIDGPLRGRRLDPEPWFYMRWHAWIYNHRDTNLYRSRRELPYFDPGQEWAVPDELRPLLTSLRDQGADVRIEGPLVTQLRPREALASLVVKVDGCRLRLHHFSTVEAATDFDALSGAWTGFPLKPKNLEGRTRRVGTLVLESDPEERFVDPLSIVPLAEDVIPWPAVVDDIDEDLAPSGPPSNAPEVPGFLEIIKQLRRRGVEVLEVGFLTPSQLRPGCENGVALTLEGDRFLLYRFTDEEQASAFATEAGHAVTSGPFVLRSVPATMYEHQGAEILYVGEEATRWSCLLTDPRVMQALENLRAPGRDTN